MVDLGSEKRPSAFADSSGEGLRARARCCEREGWSAAAYSGGAALWKFPANVSSGSFTSVSGWSARPLNVRSTPNSDRLCRRPLHCRLVESEKPTASPQRSPQTQIDHRPDDLRRRPPCCFSVASWSLRTPGTASYLISNGHLFNFAIAFLQFR